MTIERGCQIVRLNVGQHTRTHTHACARAPPTAHPWHVSRVEMLVAARDTARPSRFVKFGIHRPTRANLVSAIRGLDYGIAETHLSARSYCDKRKVHFAGAYSTTVPDLRMVPYLMPRADALASPAAAAVFKPPALRSIPGVGCPPASVQCLRQPPSWAERQRDGGGSR